MRIGIAGAGAVGCHYGSLLAQGGAEVKLLARGAHLRAMQEHGLTHETQGKTCIVRIPADDNTAIFRDADVVILACKMTDFDAMVCALDGNVRADALLMTMQNGVLAPEWLAEVFPAHAIAAASAFIGARIEAPGHVIHSAAGHVRMGMWREGDAAVSLEAVQQAFVDGGVDAAIVPDIRQLLWNKLLWNCGFNAVTALTRRFAAELLEDEASASLVRTLMRETVALAHAKEIALTGDDIEKHLELTRKAGPVKTSMWQDMEHGKPTEIDIMNGFVADEAERTGMDAPANRMLATLIRAAETGNEQA